MTGPASSVFGAGGIGSQFLLWNVGSTLSGAILGPTVQAITAKAWRDDPNIPLSPAVAASLVAHRLIDRDTGAAVARSSGVDGPVFDEMVSASTNDLDLGTILEAARRGMFAGQDHAVTDGTFRDALRRTGVREEWLDLVAQLTVQPPTAEEALQGLLEGQVSHDEALRRYLEAGGDPTWFESAFNIRGQAPTPVEAIEMANRRIIPWEGDEGPTGTSFRQAFLEGPWRNKWLTAFERLGEYLPPPRTVTAMVRNGSLSDDLALDLFKKTGLSDQLAAAYLADAKHQTAQTDRTLTASQLVQLYLDQIIDRPTAVQALESLRYSAQEADYLLGMADYRRDIAIVNAVVGRIKTLYEGRKISRTTAASTLNQVGVPAAQVDKLLTAWDLVLSVTVRQLTPAQVIDAWYAQIIGDQEAMDELTGLGYTPRDAWVLLSIKNKGKVSNEPPAGPGGILTPAAQAGG